MSSRSSIWQWTALAGVSLPLALALKWAAFPAAMLLGPMLAAVAFGLRGAGVRVPGWGFQAAQAVVGCQVGTAVTASILATALEAWWAMLLVVGATVAFGALVAAALERWRLLPSNTAAWGFSPGGAAAMTALASEYGADVRLVAFTQYLRLFVVVLTASGVSRLLLGAAPSSFQPAPLLDFGFAAPDGALLAALGVIGGGCWLGRRLRVPAGAMLLPMTAAAALHVTGAAHLSLPPWLLAVAYAGLGWSIGLRFTPDSVRHALRAIPALLGATAALIGLCALSSWFLNAALGVDPLTAYLATSPGGLDSVAVIAVGSRADVPFVLAVQTLRLFAVVLAGPLVARLVCRAASPKGGGDSCP
ncbi:hypothetical protein NNJEOMEG_00868 [Fundidesulfovibrio magnetotacticus]|uniref:Ammonia monooxygenase n=1 Tax=Fundidesulfovibrio magnetotacticus TaxID=2730080 RepID=A0A6V8LSG0_9BACT|nr:AbrB family transcriptional regulator [Fundidesulfovibrio magnetotacticus]GFK93039.1 hypothetical protein NNJEOMEG_00868 [Fundidesulfovibrio magnetotacticus]